jgi:hypothetical protein
MTHAEKLERMRKHMAALGVSPGTAAPPLWRLLWRMGLEVPPPLFLGFWPLALAMGAGFGMVWGGFMWLALWSHQGLPSWLAVGAAAGAGAMFGLSMAAVFRYFARRYKLPSWADYTGMPGTVA